MSKRVRDPIHNYISLDPAALDVVETPKYQRLRRVRQLGTASLVYPGAQHSRFEHGLGAYHLATRAARSLALAPDTGRELALAALLHDIGHGPFSHLTDFVMQDYVGKTHVDYSREALDGGVLKDALLRHGVDAARVGALIAGEGPLAPLISGPIDVDRMDYLARDSHYTGVAIGLDLERLVTGLKLTKEGLALEASALPAAEALLVTRLQMFTTVYLHRTCRAAELMVDRAIRLAIDAGEIQAESLQAMDDVALVYLLRHSKTPAWQLMLNVDQRKLAKVAWEARMDELPQGVVASFSESRKTRDGAARAIADAAGVSPIDVIVDAPPLPAGKEGDVRVLSESGEIVRATDLSPLIASLSEAERAAWRLRVLAPPKSREKVALAAAKEIHG